MIYFQSNTDITQKIIFGYNNEEFENNIIDDNEYNESLRLLKPNINIDDYYLMKDFFKLNLLPEELTWEYRSLRLESDGAKGGNLVSNTQSLSFETS